MMTVLDPSTQFGVGRTCSPTEFQRMFDLLHDLVQQDIERDGAQGSIDEGEPARMISRPSSPLQAAPRLMPQPRSTHTLACAGFAPIRGAIGEHADRNWQISLPLPGASSGR
jgi:hypothetical protein